MGCGGSKEAPAEPVIKKEEKNLHPREQPPSRKLLSIYPPIEASKPLTWKMNLVEDNFEWRSTPQNKGGHGPPLTHAKTMIYKLYPGGMRLEPFNTFPVCAHLAMGSDVRG